MNGFENDKPFLGLYEKALPDNLNWEKRLLLTRQAGYSFMELSIDSSDKRIERLKWDKEKIFKLRKISEEIEIPLLTMCLSANRKFPIGSSYKKISDKGVEIMKDAIKLAFYMGIRIVQVAGHDVLADEKSNDESKEKYLNNLARCVEFASRLGVLLAIENVEIFSAGSIKKIMYFVNSIRSPWLQIYPDVGNLSAMSLSVLEEMKLGESHIAALHVKDTVKEVFRGIPYGKGDVDFISVFKTLKEINFHGPLLLEMWAVNNEDNINVIEYARNWIEEKMNCAGYL